MSGLETIQIRGNGSTYPKIKSGSAILLIQDGIVQVGKLNLGREYDFNMEIEHPKNQIELDPQATKIVQELKPEYLKSKTSIITLCPEKIANEFIWE